MKKKLMPLTVIAVALVLGSSVLKKESRSIRESIVGQDTISRYRDGSWDGQSRYSYTDEPYWGIVRIKIENGLFTGINFMIRDSNLHETFDGNYGRHFEGNQMYIDQCRNDWNGVQTYPNKLMELQDLSKVDAISGATWSYNIFRASVDEALKKAMKPGNQNRDSV